MSEIERFEEQESAISILPPKQAPAAHAMAVLMEASQAMDIAYRYASSVCRTQVCPQRFRGKPEDGAAAILYGLEVGLSPAQSLQRVVVIHGMPSLEARTMVGLLQARGYQVSVHKIEDTFATVWGWYPDSPKVFGTDPEDKDTYGKRLNPDSTSTWTIERALQAGYVPTINPSTGKYRTNSSGKLIGNEKYITDPQAMLKAKGQAEVSRDLAPEVLMGIQYATEDLQSESWDGTIAVQRPRPEAVTVDEILSDAAPAEPEPEEQPETGQAPAPAPEPVQSRVSTEQLAEEVPEEAPADPVESPPQSTPVDETPAPAPEQPTGGSTAEPDDEEEQIPGLAETKVKQMFALLREGGINAREDRLMVFRKLAERPDIFSTKDLATRDLNKIVAKLKGYSDAKTIEADLAEIIWAAAEAEAAASLQGNTEEN